MKKITICIVCKLFCMQAVYAQIVGDTLPEARKLNEVTITADKEVLLNKTQALDIVSSDANYLNINRGSSLMNSLDRIPGVQSIQIGQGLSKPMIRGLGFNRVAVLQNGIKQQGQQWGADHGLEIDQYAVDKIEIYKGATSLQYGSDAIGGALVITPNHLKKKDGYSANILLNGTSNNMLFGTTVDNHFQKNGKYITGRITYQNFEDYRVPARSFQYLGEIYPLHHKALKNSAGRENDISIQTGIIKDKFQSNLLISKVYAKTGFFAGAHGAPTEADLEDDGKHRNIDLPYQSVDHLKVIFNQIFKLNKQHEISFDLGYQNNDRKEFAEPHTHGEDETEIPDNELELALKLQTGSLNAAWVNQITSASKLTIGIATEYQHNDIDGYSFLLPRYTQTIAGLYAINRSRLSDQIVFTSGIRYDYGKLEIDEFVDDHLPEEYRTRAANLTKNMGDVSFSAGVSYTINPQWNMKANIGKSFRMVTASELSSNGVHHGTFRHEVGDKNLKAEKSYQLDYSLEFNKILDDFWDKVQVNTSLFTNYFPNFIFLNPTGELSWMHDAGQYYKYQQSKAFRLGGEIQFIIDFAKIFSFESAAEYVSAKDLDSKYPIPFTPPFSVRNEFSANIAKIAYFSDNRFAISHRYRASQNRVARNELATPKTHIFDTSASVNIPISKQDIKLVFQLQNIFNTKYYNHLSFYRSIDLPEIGRNFRLSIQIPIVSNK